MSAIAQAYLRQTKAGLRNCSNIPIPMRGTVMALLQAELDAGEITAQQYMTYVGPPIEV